MTTTKSSNMFAEVAPTIPLPHHGPQTYTYQIPPNHITDAALYSRVRIPFGRRTVVGIITQLRPGPVPYRTKQLSPYSPVQLSAYQVALAEWIADVSHGGLGYTLRLFYPPGLRLLSPHQGNSLPDTVASINIAIIDRSRAKRYQLLTPMIKKHLSAQRQVLILVPEQSMQTSVQQSLTNNNILAEWYSGNTTLTIQRRIWHQAAVGKTQCIIGTQKSLFLPFTRLGLVIIEEDENFAHKLWDQYPRLDNRYAATQISRIHGASQAISSSTTSLSVAIGFQQGKINIVHQAPLIIKPIVFAASWQDREKKYLLPQQFISRLSAWNQSGHKVFLLSNRRGQWVTTVCKQCHSALKCPACGVALVSYSDKGNYMLCHYCKFRQPVPKQCPQGHKQLRQYGVGAEKIADLLTAQHFPQVWLDASVISHEGESKLIKRLKDRRRLILIGTTAALRVAQAVGVSRSAYLFPEQTLLFPDYRSEERAHHYLSRLQQLISPNSKVAIITRQRQLVEERLALSEAAFLKQQTVERKRLQYPPYRDLIRLTYNASNITSALTQANTDKKRFAQQDKSIIIKGPYEAFRKKRRGRPEAHLILLGDLAKLISIYQTTTAASVDLNPARVL